MAFIVITALILGTFIFVGCSSSTSTKGDVYVGKWSCPTPKDRTMTPCGFFKIDIKPNGNAYLAKIYWVEAGGQIINPIESGASLTKDGMLNISGAGTVTYVKDEDALKPDWIGVTLKREK